MKFKLILLLLLLSFGLGVIATQSRVVPSFKVGSITAPVAELTTTAAAGIKKAMQQLGVLFFNTNGTLTTGEGFGPKEQDLGSVSICVITEYENISNDEGAERIKYHTKGKVSDEYGSNSCVPLEDEMPTEVSRDPLCTHDEIPRELPEEKSLGERVGTMYVYYIDVYDCLDRSLRKSIVDETRTYTCENTVKENFDELIDEGKTIRKYKIKITDCKGEVVRQEYKDVPSDPCSKYIDPNLSIEEKATQINSYLRNSYSLVGGADDNSSATDIGSTPVIPIQQTFADLEAHIPNTSMLAPYVSNGILTNEILGGLTPQPDSRRLIMSCKYYPIFVKGLSAPTIPDNVVQLPDKNAPTEPPSTPDNTITELPKTPAGMFEYMRMHMDKYFPHPDFHFEVYNDEANNALWQNAANFGAGTFLKVVYHSGQTGWAVVSKTDNTMETGFVITILKDGLKEVDAERYVTKYQYGYKHTELTTEQSGVTEFFYKELSYGNQSESTIVNAILQYNQLKASGGNRLLGDNSGGESVGVDFGALANDMGAQNVHINWSNVKETELDEQNLAAVVNGEISLCNLQPPVDPKKKWKYLGKSKTVYNGKAWFGTNFVGPGPKGNPNPYTLGLKPLDMIDAAALKHDYYYWQKGVTGVIGALFNKTVAEADKILATDAYNAMQAFKRGEIDPITNEPISIYTYNVATEIYYLFSIIYSTKIP